MVLQNTKCIVLDWFSIEFNVYFCTGHHYQSWYFYLFCIQGKSQKAEALKAELEATRKTLDALNKTGENMQNKGHFAADSVQVPLLQLHENFHENFVKLNSC